MLFDFLAPLSGFIAIIIITSISSVLAAGIRSRRRWQREIQDLDKVHGLKREAKLERIRRAQRTSDFLNDTLRRIYYLITLVSAIILIGLPFLRLQPNARLIAGLGLSATTFLGALMLLLYWRSWGEETEGLLRRKLQQAQEWAHAGRGLRVRDELTGAYTLDYWLHVLELSLGRPFRRPIPITCLMIDLQGMAELRLKHGDEVGDDILGRIGREITRNVRASDPVCIYRGYRFAVALFRCPARFGSMVGNRIEANLEHLELKGLNLSYGMGLHLVWAFGTLPTQASTPVQLLRVVETSLDLKKSLMPLLERSQANGVAKLPSRGS